jgi:hypothetical protein
VNEKWEDIIREWRVVMYAKTEADYATAWDSGSNFKHNNRPRSSNGCVISTKECVNSQSYCLIQQEVL